MPPYMTQAGETLDAICLRVYGSVSPATETVLDRNPGLAALGAIYPSGLIIELPDSSVFLATDVLSASNDFIQLWD